MEHSNWLRPALRKKVENYWSHWCWCGKAPFNDIYDLFLRDRFHFTYYKEESELR